MKKVVLGKKFSEAGFAFRETCFGICVKDNKILLSQNVIKDEIAMVGGGIEPGEDHTECLKREFLEESGYTAIKTEPLCVVDCYWLAGGTRPMRSLANIYLVEISNNCIPATEEGHRPIWVDLDKAQDLLPLPYQKEAIKQYMQTITKLEK